MNIVSTTDEWQEKELKTWKKSSSEFFHIYSSIEEVPANVSHHTEILITYGNDLTKENLEAFPSLKWIQMISSGMEDLPVRVLHDRNIIVTNAKGVHTKSMSEYMLAVILHFEKHIHRFQKLQIEKKWDREPLVGELVNKTVLVFGTGTIGIEVTKTLQLFDMNVDGVNSNGREIFPFDTVYSIQNAVKKVDEYDYIILLLPLTPYTKGVISKEVLSKMSKKTVLINTGRGGLVDEQVLVEQLKKKALGGAVLDVFIEEPLPVDNELWSLENVLITPHMSAKSIHYLPRCMDIFIENYQYYQKGSINQLKNRVDVLNRY